MTWHRVAILTSFSDRAQVRDALAAGAIGYVLKDCTPEELVAPGWAASSGGSR